MYHDSVLKDYHIKRTKKGSFKYRLGRRSFEVLNSINQNFTKDTIVILDIGAADGLMLEYINKNIPRKDFFSVGIDLSLEILKSNPNRTFYPIQADALRLPFLKDTFDIAIATAVIEHVSNAASFMAECYRVLKKGGLCILTTPVPFFDNIYGFLKPDEKGLHNEVFSLEKLKTYFKNSGFKLMKVDKFMISPVGFTFEKMIEKAVKKIGLGFLLLNQIVVGMKE